MIKNPLRIVLIGALIIVIAYGFDAYIWKEETSEVSLQSQNPVSSKANRLQIKNNQPSSKRKTNGSVSAQDPITLDKTNETSPSFDVVRVDPGGNTVIAGRADPGDLVSIIDNGKQIVSTKADKRGQWVAVTKTEIQPGTRKLSLESTKMDGTLKKSQDPVILLTPSKKTSGEPSQSSSSIIALKIPRKNKPSEILQRPEISKTMQKLTIDIIDYDEEGVLIISGRASDDSRILIYLDNKFIGQTKSNNKNTWQLTPEKPVSPGVYELRVDQMDNNNKVIHRISTPFSRSKPKTNKSKEPFIVVQHGNSLWRLAAKEYGSGFRYTIILKANRNLIENPNLIYPGQIFKLPKAE